MDLPNNQPIKRWTAKRRSALVLTILRGKTSLAEAARKHGLTVAEVEQWKERFLLGIDSGLTERIRGLGSDREVLMAEGSSEKQ